VQTNWTGAELHDLATQELSSYCRGGEAPYVRIDGANVRLQPIAVQTIAMCVHELATNAANRPLTAAASAKVLTVKVSWNDD
jgi:two-component sensor histidine kinase